MPKKTTKPPSSKASKTKTLSTHLSYSRLRDQHRGRHRDHLFKKDLNGYRGYFGANANLEMGILEYLLNQDRGEFERLVKQAAHIALENAQKSEANHEKESASGNDFAWVLRAATINEHALAGDLARTLKRLDDRHLTRKTNSYFLMRALTLDLFDGGKIDRATLSRYADDCKPVGVKRGYIELLLGIAMQDVTRIDTAAGFIHQNIAKHASDTGLFSLQPEAEIDFWALGLIRHARKQGLSTTGMELIEHYYDVTVRSFDAQEVAGYDAVASDRQELIYHIQFEYTTNQGYDGNLRSKANGRTLADNVMECSYARAHSEGKTLHDVYDGLDIKRIFDVILPSHEFNKAGWCRVCLKSIETSIKDDQPCTKKSGS